MKKIIAALVAGLLLVSATFALEFEIGARAFGGTNFANDAKAKDITKTIGEMKKDTAFNYGFGIYTNFALFGGLGIQAEGNLTKGSTSWAVMTDKEQKATKYEILTLDVPLMAWLNLDLWKFTIGFGAGVNFSFDLPNATMKEMYNAAKLSAKDNTVRTGFVGGVDFKFYFTKHLGLVLDARYVMDFTKKEIPIDVAGVDTGVTKPTVEFQRKSLYGGLGIEWKFF